MKKYIIQSYDGQDLCQGIFDSDKELGDLIIELNSKIESADKNFISTFEFQGGVFLTSNSHQISTLEDYCNSITLKTKPAPPKYSVKIFSNQKEIDLIPNHGFGMNNIMAAGIIDETGKIIDNGHLFAFKSNGSIEVYNKVNREAATVCELELNQNNRLITQKC